MTTLEEVRQLLVNKGLPVRAGDTMEGVKAGKYLDKNDLTVATRETGPRVAAGGIKGDKKRVLGHKLLPDLCALHEFFAVISRAAEAAGRMPALRGEWDPPVMILAALAGARRAARGGGGVLWVGRKVWPTAALLRATQGSGGGDVLGWNILVDPLTLADRVWALEQGLRSAGVAVVVGDGSGMRRAASRRLQLAAECPPPQVSSVQCPEGERRNWKLDTGHSLCLLARPEWEREEESFAVGRWEVRPLVSQGWEPCWELELVRWRGEAMRGGTNAWPLETAMAPGGEGQSEQEGVRGFVAGARWVLEWVSEVDCGTGGLRVSAVVGDRVGTGGGTEGVAAAWSA